MARTSISKARKYTHPKKNRGGKRLANWWSSRKRLSFSRQLDAADASELQQASPALLAHVISPTPETGGDLEADTTPPTPDTASELVMEVDTTPPTTDTASELVMEADSTPSSAVDLTKATGPACSTPISNTALEPMDLIMEPIETEPTSETAVPKLTGRRVVEIDYFLNEVKRLSDHGPFDCNFRNMVYKGEVKVGLKSGFKFSCSMCNFTDI